MCDSVRPALLILTGLTKNLISYHNVIAYLRKVRVSACVTYLLIYSETRVTWSVKQLLGFRHLRSIAYLRKVRVSACVTYLLIYSETRVTWSVKQLLGFRHLRSIAYLRKVRVSACVTYLLIYSETRVTWSVKQLLGFRHLRSPKVPAAGSELPPLRVPLPAAALRRARARRGYRPRPGGCGGAATAARW